YGPMRVKVANRPRGRPADRPPEQSRRELISAAAHVFAERGFAAATVAEIIRRAKLSKGTFYWHFESKDELFTELLDERLDRPLRELMALTATASAQEPTAAAVGAGLEALFAR